MLSQFVIGNLLMFNKIKTINNSLLFIDHEFNVVIHDQIHFQYNQKSGRM